METTRALTGLLAGFFIFSTTYLFSQTKTLNREFEPVVRTGSDLQAFAGAPIAELFVYSYNSSEGSWTQIPFQFDEVGAIGDSTSYFISDDGLLDDDDELSFMGKDGGDKAEMAWLDDASSEGFARVEIEIVDPLTQESAWAYVYRSTTLTLTNDTDYVDYFAGTVSSAQDTIVGQTYRLANGANGLINYLTTLPAAGGSGVNFVEKQEIRINTSLNINIDETANFLNDITVAKDGNVRVVRELTTTIELLGAPVFPGLKIPVFYYGYSSVTDSNFDIPVTLPLGISIELLRQSLNLTDASMGMQFFSENNSNIAVDGTPDPFDEVVNTFPPDFTWVMLTGSQGSFVNLYTVPGLGDTQELFYIDDASVSSYGNAGFILQGADIEGAAPLGQSTFYPGSVQSGEEAALGNSLSHPIEVSQNEQSFDEVTSVDLVDDSVPEKFGLAQNYPNPFNPTTLIQYQITDNINNSKTLLVIYNLLGEKIRTLVDEKQPPGVYSATWDGKDELGKPAANGIYIYRLTVGDFVDSRKMTLLK